MTEKARLAQMERGLEELYAQLEKLRIEVEGLKVEHSNIIGYIKRGKK